MNENPMGKLATALSKAQAEFSPIVKELEVSFGTTKYKYADLAAVIDATKDALGKNGLAVTQCAEFMGERFVMHTRLIHADGGEVSSYWPLPAGGKPQEMGSALTYARRYSLSAVLNVASEADDDGQAGQSAKEGKVKEIAKVEEKTKASAPEAPKASGLWLNDGAAGSMHGTVTAYLDALEGLLSRSDDPAQMFDLNAALLQEQQAKAVTQAKTNPKAQAIVGRITAIFDHVHAGTVPGLAAE